MGIVHPPASTTARILIVDDEIRNLSLLVEALETAGYTACFAESGTAALRLMELNRYDLVILDIGMPGMDGFEVMRRTRLIPGCADVPIVFLSALSEEGTARAAFEAGGTDYMPKPFREEELLARIAHHIDENRRKRRIEGLVAEAAREMETAAERLRREVAERA